jgi:hypothetical protein
VFTKAVTQSTCSSPKLTLSLFLSHFSLSLSFSQRIARSEVQLAANSFPLFFSAGVQRRTAVWWLTNEAAVDEEAGRRCQWRRRRPRLQSTNTQTPPLSCHLLSLRSDHLPLVAPPISRDDGRDSLGSHWLMVWYTGWMMDGADVVDFSWTERYSALQGVYISIL